MDIQLVALTTAQVVAALAEPAGERAAILDPRRTAIYLHGLTPTSPGIQATFPAPGLASRNVRVPLPAEPCPACGGQQPIAPRGAAHRRLATRALAAAALIIFLVVLVIALAHS